MGTSGIVGHKDKSVYNSDDILLQNYNNRTEWINAMPKWSKQYRREYSRLYHKIKVKQNATEEDKQLFSIMGKKQTQGNRNVYHKKIGASGKYIVQDASFKVKEGKVKVVFD